MIQIQSFTDTTARETTAKANNWLKENDDHIEVISTQTVINLNNMIIIMITYKKFEEKHLTNE